MARTAAETDAAAVVPNAPIGIRLHPAAEHPTGSPPRRRGVVDLPSTLLALLLAGFVVVGESFDATDTAEWFSSSPGAAVGAGLTVLGIALVLYLPIRGGFALLDGHWDRCEAAPGLPVMAMRVAMRHWMLPTFGIVVAGWLVWLLIHYPGSVDSDTITQLFQWRGLIERTNHHPWFDTAFFGWFWDLGASVGDLNVGLFVFLVLQVVATAAGMALVITYLARLGLPGAARRTLTMVAAVYPTFAMSAGVMSKDSFAGVFWLPFFVLYVEALRTRGRVLTHPWVAIAAVLIAVPLAMAKRTNAYLLLVCVVVLLVVVARRVRLPLLAATATILLATTVLWPTFILPALGVGPATLTDMLSIPVQQTARTVATHGDRIPPDEREAIDAVLRYDGLAEAYVPRRSDQVKGRWNTNASTQEQLAYARVWIAQFARYPETYLSATANNTFEYFAPTSRLTYQTNLDLERYIDFWLSRSVEGTSREQIEEVADTLRSAPALDGARTAVDRITFSTADTLVGSKAFYCSWVPLVALTFAIRRRSWLHVLSTVPMFVNLAFLVAGPIALPRYMVPMLLGSVLVAGLTLVPVRWIAVDPRTRGRRRDGEEQLGPGVA